VNIVPSAGTGASNYTIQASNVKSLGGSNNVNIVAVMGGAAGFSYFPQVTFTNQSGSAQGFGVSWVSNHWAFIGPNGTNPPTSIPAGFELTLAMEVNLTNVVVGWTTNAVSIRP